MKQGICQSIGLLEKSGKRCIGIVVPKLGTERCSPTYSRTYHYP